MNFRVDLRGKQMLAKREGSREREGKGERARERVRVGAGQMKRVVERGIDRSCSISFNVPHPNRLSVSLSHSIALSLPPPST